MSQHLWPLFTLIENGWTVDISMRGQRHKIQGSIERNRSNTRIFNFLPVSFSQFDKNGHIIICICVAHGSFVIVVWLVTQRLVVWVLLWSLDVLCLSSEKTLYLHCLSPSMFHMLLNQWMFKRSIIYFWERNL